MDGGTGEVSGAVPLDRLARAAVLDVHSRPGGAAIDSVAAGDGRWWLHVLGVTREWKEVRFLARLRGWPERKDNPPGKNEPPPSTLSPPPRHSPARDPAWAASYMPVARGQRHSPCPQIGVPGSSADLWRSELPLAVGLRL